MPEVTVIIPNYNGISYLKTCLEALEKQTQQGVHTLVVDNGSKDESVEWIRSHHPNVQVLMLDKNYGFCTAVNRGIKAADTPYVILLNNDTQAEPEFVESLLCEIKKSPRAFSCQAKLLDFQNRSIIDDAGDFYCALGWATARGKGRREHHYSKKIPVFAACGGGAIYRRDIFTEIGFFDEKHFAYLEDIDIGYRARIYGYENYFVPAARVYHMGSATTGAKYSDWKVGLAARNSIYLAYKNMPLPQLILNGPLLLAGVLIKGLFFARKHMAKAYFRGVGQGLGLWKRENKVKYQRNHWKNYGRIQLELWRNIGFGLRKF